MLEKINIREKIKSKIELLKLETNFNVYDYGGPQGYNTSMYGQSHPYIVINGFEIPRVQISFMEIDCIGFLPKLNLSISLESGKPEYLRKVFPRAGDIVSVFIRSPNDNIRPIRNDYQVVTVDYIGSNAPSDSGDSYINITARLFIPNLYTHKSFSKKGSSYDVLTQIANELNLGFASNIEETDDAMSWMHIGNYEQYINKITDHAWKDEKSFFTTFIDFYYNINFINVNQQITHVNEGQPGLISDINIRVPSENTTFEKELKTFMLTNNFVLMSFNNYIAKYDLINNASILTYKEGVVKDYFFYDYSIMDNVNDVVSPIETEDIPSAVTSININLGTSLQNVREWLGIQYSEPFGNVHKNYNFSTMHNKFNNRQLDKMILQVSLPNPNFFVHRGQRLFVEILSYADKFDTLVTPYPVVSLADKARAAINMFLSDFYYVKGYKITYDPRVQVGFQQEVYLSKRDWINSPNRQ